MDIALKIRGIYATALTGFFLEKGVQIASPSPEIAWRFKDREGLLLYEDREVEIADLEGQQGILVRGSGEETARVVGLLKDAFPDPVFRNKGDDPLAAWEIEFPYLTKSALDEERHKIVPTLLLHHRLRIIAPEVLDPAEDKELSLHPERRRKISEDLEKRLIWDTYHPGKEIRIEHVKLDGQVIYLSEGQVVSADFGEKRLVLERRRFKGRSRYDGLDVPKEEGDYAVSEVMEGDWFYRHTYFRASGELIGMYYNINTPVEFYPDRIRYMDMEIDVVQWPDGRVDIVDEPLLERQFVSGRIGKNLMEEAKRQARRLVQDLRSCPGT